MWSPWKAVVLNSLLAVMGLCGCLVAVAADEKVPPSGEKDTRHTEVAVAPLPQHALMRLGTTWLRYQDHIDSVAWSPDGKIIGCINSRQAGARIWDLSGMELRLPVGERGGMSPSPRTAAGWPSREIVGRSPCWTRQARKRAG
jgi:hypothetical protein